MVRVRIDRQELKDLLEVYGTQKRLAKELNVSPSTVSRAIRGKTQYFRKESIDKRIDTIINQNFFFQGVITYKDVGKTKNYIRTDLTRTERESFNKLSILIERLLQSARARGRGIRILKTEIRKIIKKR